MISENRKFKSRLRFAMMTSFTAGMVNVSSLVLFFSFSSNVTGHYAIFASEIAKGNLFKIFTAFGWIALFFLGSFFSVSLLRSAPWRNNFWKQVLPMALETVCLLAVGFYGLFFYLETLAETEILVGVLLLAMGLQNGLTAATPGFGLKTTHLTGLTTDLAIAVAQLTEKRADKSEVRRRFCLLFSIAAGYVAGGVLAGNIIHYTRFWVFIYISGAMVAIILYNASKLWSIKEMYRKQREKNRSRIDKQYSLQHEPA